MAFISQFSTDIRHVSGSDNVAADAMSRVMVNTLGGGRPPTIDFSRMAAAQQEEMRQVQSASNFLVFENVVLP